MSESKILEVTSWARSTLNTYKSKKEKFKTALVFDKTVAQYRVISENLSYNHFSLAFTQVDPNSFTPAKGFTLSGQDRAYVLQEAVPVREPLRESGNAIMVKVKKGCTPPRRSSFHRQICYCKVAWMTSGSDAQKEAV